jgi:cysteinyl-tRNA synthetase
MIKLYNTSAKTIVPFKSIHPKKVSLYSCGPTVYDRQHIGNLRKSLFDDLLSQKYIKVAILKSCYKRKETIST